MFTFIICNRNCIYQKEGFCYKTTTEASSNICKDTKCNFYFPKQEVARM